ncbi:MAG: DUF4160 domain-containing protein, partial [Bacteroidota bacterium]
EFYGIVIYLYYADHNPPHFHAVYGGQQAEINIRTGDVMVGVLPKRALRLISEWGEAYREELLANWERARAGQPLQSIPPLT